MSDDEIKQRLRSDMIAMEAYYTTCNWHAVAVCADNINHYAAILARESKADESGTIVATDAPPWVEDALTKEGLRP